MDYFRIVCWATLDWPKAWNAAWESSALLCAGAGAAAGAWAHSGPGSEGENVISTSLWHCSISLRFVKQTSHKDQSYLSIIELLPLL